MKIRKLHRVLPLVVGGAMLVVAGSCLRETPLPVVAEFETQIEGQYNTSPLTVAITNHTTGADFFEWTFDGGQPTQSNEKNPPNVIFTTPGEHLITLRAWNMNVESTKEMSVRVDPTVTIGFDCEVLVNDFAPAEVQINNHTEGAKSYEWTFGDGIPATSALENPGVVAFGEGVHRIHLRVSNGSESFETERTVTIRPPMKSDFSMEPTLVDEDMEAPLTAVLKNTSSNYLSVEWSCEGGVIAEPMSDETTVRFASAGTYTVVLRTDNAKEQHTVRKDITVKENSGIHTFGNLHFGINQAKNSIGCFFSSYLKRVVRSNEIISAETGARIDIVFFALNSEFGDCCFFAPDKAVDFAFGEIAGAGSATVRNAPTGISAADFKAITKAADLDVYNFAAGNDSDRFGLDNLPVFAFFTAADGRRGIVMIKDVVRNGADSYAVADIKIEKRSDE